MQIVNNLQFNGWSCSPKHERAHSTELKHFLVWMVWSFSNTIKILAGPCSPKHGPVSFTVLNNFFCLDVMQPFKNHSSLWLGRAPQHPLSRPSWFCGVEECFRRDVMQIVNNGYMNGWSCSPKHDPVFFTVLKHFLVWMVWSFSNANKLGPGDCSPKHGPVSFTVLKNFFRLDVMQPFKTILVYGWAALPNIPCHGPADFAALKNVFVVMLCRLSTTVKWTAGRAHPNTVQFFSQC